MIGCAGQASIFNLPENFEMFRVPGLEHLAKLFIVQQTLLTSIIIPIQLNNPVPITNIDTSAILEVFKIINSEPTFLPFVYIIEYTQRMESTTTGQFSSTQLQSFFFILQNVQNTVK